MTMEWRFPAVPESVSDARRAARNAAERLGADDGVLASIQLCVSEAVTNAVVHAYLDRPAQDIKLEVDRRDGFVYVTVRDSGGGMRPRPDSPGAGFGLPLIGRLASEVAVRSNGASGTEMVMRFEMAS